MWAIAGVIVISGLCAAIEMPSLKGQKKEQWVFWLLLVLGAGLGIAFALKVPIPNPLDLIAFLFKPIGYWLHNALQPSQ
ncbi:hypothetical protein [Paenibacillus montanisoli]|uniref:Uncharacterized protein n=1 Tax=Paenibacillus montanisoli TaxID=2081970 RepID=A0A328TZP9_9BACL|nr:hypothetical protein [Paenibacillus montanisoli]RAP75840.1 hypothetical protein DL346_10400 [Paenibacillus montanisoli]